MFLINVTTTNRLRNLCFFYTFPTLRTLFLKVLTLGITSLLIAT